MAAPSAGRELPFSGHAPALARQFVRDTCREHAQANTSDLMLLVSEAVTNAITHGQPPVHLNVDCHQTAITVKVTDHGPGIPVVMLTDPDAMGGRGMFGRGERSGDSLGLGREVSGPV